MYYIYHHDNVIKWKHFPRYWPFVRGIHRSPVNSPHKGQWRGALMFSLICVWINGWATNGEAADLRRYRAHCDVTVMIYIVKFIFLYRNCCNLFQITLNCYVVNHQPLTTHQCVTGWGGGWGVDIELRIVHLYINWNKWQVNTVTIRELAKLSSRIYTMSDILFIVIIPS